MITWYTFSNSEGRSLQILQTVMAYLSAGSIFIMLVLVIVFHVYRYGSAKVYHMGQNSKLGRKVLTQLSHDQDHRHHAPLDNTLLDVVDRPRTDDVYVPPSNSKQPHTLPTSSEVLMTDSQALDCPESNNNSESIENGQSILADINNTRGSKRLKSLETPLFRSHLSEPKISQRSKPLVLSYRAQGSSNASIIEPLLKEETV